ncbi:MAG: pilus assembly protein PilM [Eubacteriales bacterium]|nr:pilus assembly protein PilM [Eubacteriales bacterium]
MAKILSIEVELSQVRVAEMDQRGSGKKARIYQWFSFAIDPGTVEDGQIRDTQGLGELLKEELSAHKVRTKKVSFTVACSRIASREVLLPYVKEKKVQAILEENMGDYFPVDPAKYALSYSIMGVTEKEKEEKQYRLMVYAAPKSLAAAYRETAQAAGLSLVRMDYVGSSTYGAVAREFQKGTHLLMKIEELNTLVTIVKDGELALQRNLNYGVNGAIETVRAYPVFGRGLSPQAAMELLKTRSCIRRSLDMDPLESEEEDTDEFVREARREVTESLRYLVGSLSRIIDYYVSRNQDAEFESLLCCGMGAEFLGLPRLLGDELGQKVEVLSRAEGIHLPRGDESILSAYASVAGSYHSSINFLKNESRGKREKRDGLSGAILVFLTGLVGSVVLAGAGIGMRIYQEGEQERLNRRISEESSIEAIYNTYNTTKEQFARFERMYAYTNTPNEGLVGFIEEMEEKMPASITVDTFTSTGTEVSFSMRLASKAEAANALIQLRSFESLEEVKTSGITESEEDGTISLSVHCTYKTPALLDTQE